MPSEEEREFELLGPSLGALAGQTSRCHLPPDSGQYLNGVSLYIAPYRDAYRNPYRDRDPYRDPYKDPYRDP